MELRAANRGGIWCLPPFALRSGSALLCNKTPYQGCFVTYRVWLWLIAWQGVREIVIFDALNQSSIFFDDRQLFFDRFVLYLFST
jgi:hypothetical protein